MIPEQPARQDGVPLTIYIPGQCLSFSQYQWGRGWPGSHCQNVAAV